MLLLGNFMSLGNKIEKAFVFCGILGAVYRLGKAAADTKEIASELWNGYAQYTQALQEETQWKALDALRKEMVNAPQEKKNEFRVQLKETLLATKTKYTKDIKTLLEMVSLCEKEKVLQEKIAENYQDRLYHAAQAITQWEKTGELYDGLSPVRVVFEAFAHGAVYGTERFNHTKKKK